MAQGQIKECALRLLMYNFRFRTLRPKPLAFINEGSRFWGAKNGHALSTHSNEGRLRQFWQIQGRRLSPQTEVERGRAPQKPLSFPKRTVLVSMPFEGRVRATSRQAPAELTIDLQIHAAILHNIGKAPCKNETSLDSEPTTILQSPACRLGIIMHGI